MAQKTILSFFKSHELSNDQTVQPTKSRKNKRTDKIIKSEAKQEKTVKRTKRSRQIIESDEEDIVNGENSSLNESLEGKQLDTESNDEKSNCRSQDNSSKEAKKEEHIKEDEQSSEVIPKRLTARKHMKRKLKTEITQANSAEYRSVKKRKSDISNDRKAENSDNETMETNEQISTKELVSNEISNERNGQISSENSENSSLDDSGEKKTLKAKQKRKTEKQNIDKPTKKQQKKVFKKNSKDDVSETTKKVSSEDSENSSVDDSGENKMLKAKSKQKKKIAKQNIDKPAKKEQKNIFEKNLKDNVSKIIKKVSSEYSENSSLDDSGENKTLKEKSKQKKKPAKQDIDKPAKKQQKKVFEKNLKNNASETTKKVEETKNVSNKGKQKNAGKKPKNEGDESSINETKVNVEEHQESSTEDIINDKSENTEEESRTKIKAKNIKESAECQTKKPVHSFFAPRKKKVQGNSNTESEKDGKESPKDSKIINSHSAQNDSSSYNPSKHHYHPIDDATWKKGEKVPYLALARTLEEIENISARLKMIEILANFFRSVIVLAPEDLLCSVYLCLNKVAPEYEGIEMGVGDTVLMKAVAQATGRTVEKIKAEVTVKGDLGLVAESSRGNQRVMFAPPKLTVSAVFSKFKEIAQMAGNAVMSKKIDKIQALFVACRNCEARYIIRSLSGKLRIGLAEQSVLAALAQAAVLTPPNQPYPPQILNSSSSLPAETFKKKLEPQTVILKTTYCECPNYDLIIPVLLKEGIDGLPNHCHLTAGIPLKPMLAHPTKGIDEVLRRFDNIEFTCEFKYDGERAQIHTLENGDVKIYSRNQENNTSKYPDIISRIPKILKPETKSCIIDSEAVAWDAESKQILPFQVLSTRKRKDAVESEITVQVCIVAFDLLYLNGESLVKYPLIKRRELLHQSFTEIENEFMFVQSADGKTAETMQEFLEESIKGNCEGLMVKSLEVDASYEIAKRSHNWLKLKKDYLEGVGDTLDVVVIGGYHGKGKRTGTYGGFLLACYDNENEEFQSICKIGTGFKDEELEAHTTFLKQHVINEPKSYYRFDSSLKPDEWVEPVQVWEIKCADLSKSPVHKAAIGIVDPEKGISLRFPRFIRIREDKKPEDATTASQVAQMYNSQEQVQNQKMKDTKQDDDEEFY